MYSDRRGDGCWAGCSVGRRAGAGGGGVREETARGVLRVLCESGGFFFFFQAEDGIRDYKVTGVQTCALPIFACHARLNVRQDVRSGSGSRDIGSLQLPLILRRGAGDPYRQNRLRAGGYGARRDRESVV